MPRWSGGADRGGPVGGGGCTRMVLRDRQPRHQAHRERRVHRPVAHGARRYADVVIIAVLVAAVAVLSWSSHIAASTPTTRRSLCCRLRTWPRGRRRRARARYCRGGAAPARKPGATAGHFAHVVVFVRNSTEDARTIGGSSVRYLLEGSVQSDRTRMRVTTQLIDTQSGADVVDAV